MIGGQINLTYTHFDRYIAGGAVPTSKPLTLKSIDPLRAKYFLERRKLGIINVGGKGTVTVGNKSYSLKYKEALYVGRGTKKVVFASDPYTFIWGMAGENLDYGDMDGCAIKDLK